MRPSAVIAAVIVAVLAVFSSPAAAQEPPADAPAPLDTPPAIEPGPQEPAAPGAPPKAAPKPDPVEPRNDLGLLTPVAQCCGGIVVAWLPIPCVTSAAAGYAVTAAGNGLSSRDNAALGPMIAGVVTDLVVVGVIAGGYGIAVAGVASGSQEAAFAALIGGPALVGTAFFARPFLISAVTTVTWQLQAEERGAVPWMPPPLFVPDDDEAAAKTQAGVAAR